MIIHQIGDIHLNGGNELVLPKEERLQIAAKMYQLAAEDAKKDGRVRTANKYAELVEEAYDQMQE
jgi:hypothetical protein